MPEENILNEAVETVDAVDSIANGVEQTVNAVVQTQNELVPYEKAEVEYTETGVGLATKLAWMATGGAVVGLIGVGCTIWKRNHEMRRAEQLGIDVEALIKAAAEQQGINLNESPIEKGKNFLKNKKANKQAKTETTNK